MSKVTRLMKTNAYEEMMSLMTRERPRGGVPVSSRPLPARTLCEAGETSTDKAAKVRKGRTLLVAVDFSEVSTKALDYAVSLARRMDAKVMLFHVLDGNYGEAFLESSARLRERARAAEHARRKLAHLAASWKDRRVPMECMVRRGNPEYEICRLAEAGLVHLIVLGRKRRSAVSRLVLGSVISAVIELAPCPVVVVPDRDMECDPSG